MSDFSSFSKAEQELLASLPYKVGVWVSYAEDEEGEHDDEQEMKALEQALKAIAALHEEQRFVSAVLRATLSSAEHYNMWAEDSFTVLKDVRAAVVLLHAKASVAELQNYRAALMEVAYIVAQAYGEFGDFDDDDEETSRSGFFGKIIAKAVDRFSGLSEDDEGHPMNVSATEDSAISDLAQALEI